MNKLNDLSIRADKDYSNPSVFRPENLLREARRQKSLEKCAIPNVCVLDPDGDLLDYLRRTGRASRNQCWAGYHTRMYEFDLHGQTVGIIGRAVGASFAVLLAEQMFVSGCNLLISMTSAGIIKPPPEGEKFVLIREALRDEGTSYHYLPPEQAAVLAPDLLDGLQPLLNCPETDTTVGKSWTTDAPFRESSEAIQSAERQGVMAVEMEAAALYAFAKARSESVVCFAHLTNSMARQEHDFEKGAENGGIASLKLIGATITALNFDG